MTSVADVVLTFSREKGCSDTGAALVQSTILTIKITANINVKKITLILFIININFPPYTVLCNKQ